MTRKSTSPTTRGHQGKPDDASTQPKENPGTADAAGPDGDTENENEPSARTPWKLPKNERFWTIAALGGSAFVIVVIFAINILTGSGDEPGTTAAAEPSARDLPAVEQPVAETPPVETPAPPSEIDQPEADTPPLVEDTPPLTDETPALVETPGADDPSLAESTPSGPADETPEQTASSEPVEIPAETSIDPSAGPPDAIAGIDSPPETLESALAEPMEDLEPDPVQETELILATAGDNPANDEANEEPAGSADEDEIQLPGWKKDVSEALDAFLNASSHEERLDLILEPERLGAQLAAHHRGEEDDESAAIHGVTAADFTHAELPGTDHDNGIFLMIHEDESGGHAAPPHRTYAYFKETEDGLKLDWETFRQTRHSMFSDFISRPQPGVSRVFRVFITEEPSSAAIEGRGHRAYHIADVADFQAATRVRVTTGSPAGRILGEIEFADEDTGARIMRNATVELRWTDQPVNSAIELSKFICWEFLGLGGERIVE